MRANEHTAMPVVVMTARSSAARACQELGAQDYLARPFDLVDLLACVGKWATVD